MNPRALPASGSIERGPVGLDIDGLRKDLRAAFEPAPRSGPPRIGVELEWIPLMIEEGVPPAAGAVPAMLRGLAAPAGWLESPDAGEDPLRFTTAAGGQISLEPGGQVEYSSPPLAGTGPLLRDVSEMSSLLTRGAHENGMSLVSRGIDPVTRVQVAELRVANDRYRRLARHLDRFGSAGRRMMRQTAALHVNLDFGPQPLLQWRVANALAPFLIAIFANSSRYGGRETGFRSFRAQQWRELDPGGRLVSGGGEASLDEAVDRYLSLALDAPAILLGEEDEQPVRFSRWMGRVGIEEWRRHLTTLFPEVRPRGYLEIRSCDAVPVGHLAAPIVLLVGLLYDEDTLGEVDRALPAATPRALEEAGRVGLRDPARRDTACALVEAALRGARRLGAEVVDNETLERAEHYFRSYTARGLDPAGDGAYEAEDVEPSGVAAGGVVPEGAGAPGVTLRS